MQTSKNKFDLDLQPFDPKIKVNWSIINVCQKLLELLCIVQKPLFLRQMDRRIERLTATVKPVYPHNFVGGV